MSVLDIITKLGSIHLWSGDTSVRETPVPAGVFLFLLYHSERIKASRYLRIVVFCSKNDAKMDYTDSTYMEDS